MIRVETRRRTVSHSLRARHAGATRKTTPRRTAHLSVRPAARVEQIKRNVRARTAARNLAYRRLAAHNLDLDEATLANHLVPLAKLERLWTSPRKQAPVRPRLAHIPWSRDASLVQVGCGIG